METAMTGMLETYRGTVYPWHCDHMEHMNVMWYVGKFDEGTWNFFSRLGMTPNFMRTNNRGMAAVDQRIAYQRELHAGDTVAIRSGVIEVREKLVRFFHEMRNGETNEVAAITLLVGVHMDTQTRKSCALPESVAAAARQHIVDYQLPW
jgi:acyl-CoA thioester hydrolase